MTRDLILLGHGSHLNPDSSAPVYAHARRIREQGLFDAVHVGFWKEEPSLARCLDASDAEDVTIVPLFISGGYFTEEVIPREMGLGGPITRRDDVTIRYARPVGDHPSLAEIILERAEELNATGDEALVVLGHGTPRNPNSERNIYRHADRVRESGRFPEVATLFLDQAPDLGTVWSAVSAEDILVIPLFMADGWHVGQTIPADLDLEGGTTEHDRRHLRFGAAVGTHPSLARVIEELAGEASQRRETGF